MTAPRANRHSNKSSGSATARPELASKLIIFTRVGRLTDKENGE